MTRNQAKYISTLKPHAANAKNGEGLGAAEREFEARVKASEGVKRVVTRVAY